MEERANLQSGATVGADRYSVAVRSLCEFTARCGDLAVRFTPAPSAQQGIAGHAVVASRRGAEYQRELTLRSRYGALSVNGRADGYDRKANRLEEFKTHRGDLSRMPDNQRALHWAQLKIYGAMLCEERALPQINLALIYFDIQSEQESALEQSFAAADLEAYFAGQCERFLHWALQELEHRGRRDLFLTALDFPHRTLRPRQREMSAAVYRSVCGAKTLMMQAPTGIGKTLGTLYPMLKAAPRQRLDRVFYLVAKTSGRKLALDALRALTAALEPAPLRVLELTAKDSACEMPGRACDGASCPLAQGFYDRLPRARAAALEHTILNREALRRVALEEQICPYFLSLEMARWCDVVVGDYNYYFDSSAMLQGLTAQNDWRIGVLVDEAHNLVARARDLYSATLVPAALAAARQCAPATLQVPLDQLQRVWRAQRQGGAAEYTAYSDIPRALTLQLERVTTAIADELTRDPAAVAEDLLRLYFDALHFCRMAEAFGSHSLFDVSGAAAGTLCIRNVNPAPFLAPRFAAATTAVLFSATLSPVAFYRRLLGLPDASWVCVASPFEAGQLSVRVERSISTRFRDRSRSVPPIVALMERQYRAQPGNYLAFFSSFEYLRTVLSAFIRQFPEVPVLEQVQGMRLDERDAFLGRFTAESSGIGFAVLGGVFAEGIDLPGDRLIGAFIATLGMPQVNAVNAEIERRLQDLFGEGYEYTYLYPGLQRVVQAAGRVIRSPTDRGCVYLMDDRYAASQVRRLLPAWWRIQCC